MTTHRIRGGRRSRAAAAAAGALLALAPGAQAGGPGSPHWAEHLFRDPIAREPGDIVTVIVLESAQASGSVSSESKRDEAMAGGPGTGRLDAIPDWGLTSNNETKGEALTGRRGSLAAKVPARVVEVLPDGTLRLEGSREVKVNSEREILTVAGLVRPADIAADNTIVSSLMAEARIEYTGKGTLTNGQRPSRIMQVFSWLF